MSHSTPEAEIVAADTAIRTLGIPAIDLWDVVFDKTTPVEFLEDSESIIVVINSGKNPTMRHLQCTHDVSIG